MRALRGTGLRGAAVRLTVATSRSRDCGKSRGARKSARGVQTGRNICGETADGTSLLLGEVQRSRLRGDPGAIPA